MSITHHHYHPHHPHAPPPLCPQFGPERVGLLTGDTNINRGAQVTIMTTEVFRNMLYSGDMTELDQVRRGSR
jgi:superfamily II RNA helicase